MDIRENKLELGVAILTVIAAVGFFRAFGGAESGKDLTQDISYEMPRPKSDLVGEFGLGDREIDRQYVNPFSRTAAAVAAKKADPKKAAAKAKINARAAAAAAFAQYEAHRRAAYFRMIEKARMGFANTVAAQTPPQAPPQEDMVAGKAPSAGSDDSRDEKQKLSPAQWRALLSAQTTQANMKKLVDAIAANEAEESTFLDIVEDLLKNQNVEKQNVALYGLSIHMTPRTFAFAFGVKSDPKMPSTIQGKMDTYLDTYASKPAALVKAMQMNGPVALKAAEITFKAIQSAKTPSTGPNPNPGQQSTSLADWKRFQQVFRQLATSTDAQIQSAAQSILNLFPPTQA